MEFVNFNASKIKNTDKYEIIGTAGNVPRDITILSGLDKLTADYYKDCLKNITSNVSDDSLEGIHVVGGKWMFAINPNNSEMRIYLEGELIHHLERKTVYGFSVDELLKTIQSVMISLTALYVSSSQRMAIDDFLFKNPELHIVFFMNKQFETLKAQFMPKKV